MTKEHNLDMCVRFSSNLTLCGAGVGHGLLASLPFVRQNSHSDDDYWHFRRYLHTLSEWAHRARKDEPVSEMIDEILIKWILRENAIVRKGW